MNNLSTFIDHTLLKEEASENDIRQLCSEAKQYGFKTVCVRPKFVKLCRSLLKDSNTLTISVLSFPLGTNSLKEKKLECQTLIRNGAQEIDMVINVPKLKAQQYRYVYRDIRQIVHTAGDIPVKVILETCLLTEDEIISACVLSKAAGAAFVKTSTGFSHSGATTHNISLMRRIVGPKMGVKASGGVRTKSDALAMINAGANRIGTSNGVAIVSENHPTSAQNTLY